MTCVTYYCDVLSLTAESLENALVVSPRQESTLFSNRDKFELVVIYDESSQSYGSERSPLAILMRIMFEMEFKKILKHTPMMLVGGLEAWKRTVGEVELIKGMSSLEIEKPVPTKNGAALFMTSSNSASASNSNGSSVPAHNTGAVHELWQPRRLEQSDTFTEHRPTMSLDQSAHARFVFSTTTTLQVLISLW